MTPSKDTLVGRIEALEVGESYFFGERVALDEADVDAIAAATRRWNSRSGNTAAQVKRRHKSREFQTEAMRQLSHSGAGVFIVVALTRTA